MIPQMVQVVLVLILLAIMFVGVIVALAAVSRDLAALGLDHSDDEEDQ